MTDPELALFENIRQAGLPIPHTEYRGIPGRKFRFDGAWPELMICYEVEGGQWIRGRHQRPIGYEKDCEKYNLAALEGWKVLRFTPAMIDDGRALATIEEAIKRELS